MGTSSKQLQQQVQNLLADAVMVLCKNTLLFDNELCVEGLLGITLDQQDVLLINIKEVVERNASGANVNTTCRVCGGNGRTPVAMQPTARRTVGFPTQQAPPFESAPPQPIPRSANRNVTIKAVRDDGTVDRILLPGAVFPTALRVPVTPEIDGHSSGDEVAATLIKKPRLAKREEAPRMTKREEVPRVCISRVRDASVTRTSPSPRNVRVKIEPQKDTGLNADPKFSNQPVEVFHKADPVDGCGSVQSVLKTSLSTDGMELTVENMPQVSLPSHTVVHSDGGEHIHHLGEPLAIYPDNVVRTDGEHIQQLGEPLAIYPDKEGEPLAIYPGQHFSTEDLQEIFGSVYEKEVDCSTGNSPGVLAGCGTVKSQVITSTAEVATSDNKLHPFEVVGRGSDTQLQGGANSTSDPVVTSHVVTSDPMVSGVQTVQARSVYVPDSIEISPTAFTEDKEEECGVIILDDVIDNDEDDLTLTSAGGLHITPASGYPLSTDILTTGGVHITPASGYPLSTDSLTTGGLTFTPPTELPLTANHTTPITTVRRIPLSSSSSLSSTIASGGKATNTILSPSVMSSLSSMLQLEQSNIVHVDFAQGSVPLTSIKGSVPHTSRQSSMALVPSMQGRPGQAMQGRPPTQSTQSTLPSMEYPCPFCNKMFTNLSALVRHKRIHKGAFCQCSLCGRKFHRRDVLNKHLAMHARTQQPVTGSSASDGALVPITGGQTNSTESRTSHSAPPAGV